MGLEINFPNCDNWHVGCAVLGYMIAWALKQCRENFEYMNYEINCHLFTAVEEDRPTRPTINSKKTVKPKCFCFKFTENSFSYSTWWDYAKNEPQYLSMAELQRRFSVQLWQVSYVKIRDQKGVGPWNQGWEQLVAEPESLKLLKLPKSSVLTEASSFSW